MTARRYDLSKEALSRLPELDIGELRQQWRGLYKAEAPPQLSRELLERAIAYRMQELALGNLRPEPQRRLRQIAQDLKETGTARMLAHRELKSGTRLMRQWHGCIYEVLVLEDGFSWQGTCYRSLSAVARTITGTAWSGPLFFGLKQDRSESRSLQMPDPAGDPMEDGDAAG